VVFGSVLLAGNWVMSLVANGYALAAPMARGCRPLAITGLALSALAIVTAMSTYHALALFSQPGSNVITADMVFGGPMDIRGGGGRSSTTEGYRIATGLAWV